ncbi:MAG: RsmD family RNA methyltransferase, partial [Thermodesulfobacteriota bacterium]
VREAVFNVLGQDLSWAGRILDLFAGTGAMCIEALSRGAGEAVFVDNDVSALAIVRKNLALCGFTELSSVLKKDAASVAAYFSVKGAPFDLIFIDAPYADVSLTNRTLGAVSGSSILKEDGILVCEAAKRNASVVDTSGFDVIKEKTYGDTAVWFLKKKVTPFSKGGSGGIKDV